MVSAENNYLKTIGYFFLLTLITFFLAGCKIEGNVSEQGQGVKDVTVNLTGTKTSTTLTRDNGYFKFKYLDKGEYTVSLSKTGYAFEPVSQTIVIEGRFDAKTINFEAISNKIPIADPQNITLDEDSSTAIVLTGSDQDNDPLTFNVQTNPEHGQLTGTAPDIAYTPSENYNGIDSFTFVANDGKSNSEPAVITIEVTPVIDPPAVTLSADPTEINKGETSTLTWTSTNADTCTIEPNIGNVNPNGSIIVTPQETTTYTITASNEDGTATDSVEIIVLILPEVSLSAQPSTINSGSSSKLTWSSAYADSCTIEPGIGSVNPNGSVAVSPNTTTTYTITASNSEGTITDTAEVTVSNPPLVTLSANPISINQGGTSTLTWTSTNTDTCSIEPDIGDVELNGSVEVTPQETITYTITAINADGSATSSVEITTKIPPAVHLSVSETIINHGESVILTWNSSPAQKAYFNNAIGEVAPSGTMTLTPEYTTTYTITSVNDKLTSVHSISVKVLGNPPEPQPEGTFGEQYNDLIPSDASFESYDPDRFIVLTGLIEDISGNPLQNVKVEIINHSEYGSALSDETGRFSIPAQGGTLIKISYTKNNYLTLHRRKTVPVKDIVTIDTITLLQRDTAETFVTFDGNPETIITHKSTEFTDESGPRSCTMIFTGDNKAYELDKYGNRVKELTSITTRATEYITPESMPSILPPTTAFTYCAELEADGIERIEFDKPITNYVDNFLGFDVGEIVPVGYYDRDLAEWVGSENGIVVTLLDTDFDGIVDSLDADGDDLPDDLNNSGSTTDEVIGLDSSYQPGKTYWRFKTKHFTPFDCNWPSGPPLNAIGPNSPTKPNTDDDKPCFVAGTLIHTDKGLKLIEDIQTGDFVWSKDEKTSNPLLQKVTKTLITPNREIYKLIVSNAGGEKVTIGTTEDHPFWVKEKGWISTIDLKPGDKISTIKNKLETVIGFKKDHSRKTVYNIEVANSHTYFVGESGLWVHNTCTGKIDHRTRVLNESVPIQGTGMRLHYTSDRVQDYKTYIDVPVSGDSVPESLKRIIVKCEIAGIIMERTLDPLPNQKELFLWNGLDYNGNAVKTSVSANIRIGFEYDRVYYLSRSESQNAWARAGRTASVIRGRQEIILWQYNSIKVNPKKNIQSKDESVAEGWTISLQHHLSPENISLLHKGNGTIIKNNIYTIKTVAGNGTPAFSGDGCLATDASLNNPTAVAVDIAGNIYIADCSNNRIRKVDTSGIITTIAGKEGTNTASGNFNGGDGGPARDANIYAPWGVAVDGVENLYISERGSNRIRKIDTNGIITTVAGKQEEIGTYGSFSGDGGPATDANLAGPSGIVVDNAGNIYFADRNNGRLRKVDNSGVITTVAGGGETYGDGIPATDATLGGIFHWVTVDSVGNIYISNLRNNSVRKVDNSGIITTVAGHYNMHYHSGDGGLATDAGFDSVGGVAVDSVGNLYISTYHRIRKIDTNGIIITVAGKRSGTPEENDLSSGDGGPATDAGLGWLSNVAVDSTGYIYTVAGRDSHCIRKVGPPSIFQTSMIGGDIPFVDQNGLGYIMDNRGKHKKTINLDTGKTLKTFEYEIINEKNYLVFITDQFGNQAIINRDIDGTPTSIISPDGLKTSLSIDANNHLTSIINPDNGAYNFTYSSGGLLQQKIEPNGNTYNYLFNENGRVTDSFNEEDGHDQFQRIVDNDGTSHNYVTTTENNQTSHENYLLSTGKYTSKTITPSGDEKTFTRHADGLLEQVTSLCGNASTFKYDIDSEYKYKYVKESTITSPSGLVRITQNTRSYVDTNNDGIPDLITKNISLNNKTASIVHNALSSTKTITSPEGRQATLIYDPDTLVADTLSIPGLNQIDYLYNTTGRIESITTGARTVSYTYDSNGYLDSVTNPENHTISYINDKAGRVLSTHRPDGSTLEFTYDKNGNMTVLTNPDTINHTFGYNKVSLRNNYTTPLSGSYSYIYDKDRRLIQKDFPSGKAIYFDYSDPDNLSDKSRLWTVTTPEGTINLTYSCSTKVESITKDTESINYTYDGSLITSEPFSGLINQTLSLTYNNDFNVGTFTYAGDTASYSYDNDGLLTGSGGYTISRNAQNGLPESLTDNTLILDRTFNAYGELSQKSIVVSSNDLFELNIVSNNNGRITNKTETVEGTSSDNAYTYDQLGRLLTVTKDATLVEEYRYDLKGTRNYEMNTLRGITGRTFTYSDGDHLLTAGSDTYQYDLDGFLTSKTIGANTTAYTYSSRGELLNVTLPDSRYIEYVHDPIGRRIAKKIDGVIIEKYLWAGKTTLLAIFDQRDNLIMRFEYADGRMPVSMVKQGIKYSLIYDQVGSLRIVSDSAGNIVKQINYDSFGNIITDTDPTFTIPFGFAGGLHDRDTGLVKFGYRDYDPDIGRWTAKDPIGFAGGDSDLWGYVLNDPVNFVDPLGLNRLGIPFGQGVSGLDAEGRALEGVANNAFKAMYGTYDTAMVGMGYAADQAAQVAAEVLASKHISPIAGSILKKLNALLGIVAFGDPAYAPTDIPGIPSTDTQGCE